MCLVVSLLSDFISGRCGLMKKKEPPLSALPLRGRMGERGGSGSGHVGVALSVEVILDHRLDSVTGDLKLSLLVLHDHLQAVDLVGVSLEVLHEGDAL